MSIPRMLRQQNFFAVGGKQWAWNANSYLLYSNIQTYSHLNDSLLEGINHCNKKSGGNNEKITYLYSDYPVVAANIKTLLPFKPFLP